MARQQAPRLWQPPGWAPAGAAAFLRALVEGDEALDAWVRGGPGEPWAQWLAALGLAPYAWHRLKASGCAASVAPELGKALRTSYYASVADTELHATEAREVLGRLADAGVAPVLFKGAALAYTAYPDPACRPMGDLDLWVPEPDMPLARSTLGAAGYREHVKAERPLDMQRQLGGEVQLTGTRPGSGLVELHWSMFSGEWLRRTAAVDNEGIRSRARVTQIAGCDALIPAPEDAAIQLAVHLAVNHQMAFPGVRGLLDLALLARTSNLDWTAVAARAQEWRVATATWLVLRLAAELFGLAGTEAALVSLAPPAGRRVVLQRFVDGPHLLEGRDMTGGSRRLAFQLLLVDRARDAARLVGRTLWPEEEWLRMRYGSAGAGVRGRHLARAARGAV